MVRATVARRPASPPLRAVHGVLLPECRQRVDEAETDSERACRSCRAQGVGRVRAVGWVRSPHLGIRGLTKVIT